MNKHLTQRARWSLLITGIALVVVAGVVYAQTAPYLPNDPFAQLDANDLPSDKAAFLEQVEATQEAAETAIPTAAKNTISYPSPVSTPVWPSGILTGDISVPLPSEFYQIQNMWQGVIGSDHVQVYAGLKRELVDPSQGVLVIETSPVTSFLDLPATPSSMEEPDPSAAPGEYLAPNQAGSLYISSASGTCLTIVAGSATTPLQFDVAARTWSCSSTP